MRSGLFVAEGEDLVPPRRRPGWEPEVLLCSGQDVEPELLDRVSQLGLGHAGDRRLPPALGRAGRRPVGRTSTAWATRATWAR